MNLFSKLFKRNRDYKYEDNDFLIEFNQNIVRNKDDDSQENSEKDYVNYVNAKDISPDLKVRGTKYYKGNTIGSDIKFTIYLRVRYDKNGRDYVMEPLITQLGSISDNARTNTTVDIIDCIDGSHKPRSSYMDICDINVYDLLKGHLDYILEDIVDNRICTYFSFKHYKDKNGRDVEGYLAFDSKNGNTKYVDYLKQLAISSSTN